MFLVFALSFSVFADNSSVSPKVSVPYTLKVTPIGSPTSGTFTVDSSSASSSISKELRSGSSFTFGNAQVVVNSSGTTSFQLYPVPSDFSASALADGFSVSYEVAKDTATVIVTADDTRTTNLCLLDISSTFNVVGGNAHSYSLGVSGYTYSASGPPTPPPENPYAGSGSMFGWTGKILLSLELAQSEKWYEHSIGSKDFAQMDSLWTGMDGEGTLRGGVVIPKMLASLAWNKWKWSIDPNTGLPKFEVDSWSQGSWADMIYRTSVYNYFYASKLWSNDVSGSWYGSISSSFSYLNYRVNQILEVLANDEDLAIKDATTPERDWVKNYFNGSGDKADSGKYDKLNDTGSAFKDAFSGAPDSSIADGFTAVNDNGYEFWTQGVSDDINGNSVSSSSVSRSPAYVPPEQRIIDAYSENWAQIVGGYYD